MEEMKERLTQENEKVIKEMQIQVDSLEKQYE